ncbi:MAG: DeoR/GlpR family DNA-binding transcription regulator [Treponema sp.]|nr:DeoR/GlpR family DNA-binding transcription regulator [Treponema sp.]
MTNRQTKILQMVSKNDRCNVISLAEMMGVSQVTIRKDLDTLEERGLIKREHGYACMSHTDDVGRRIAHNYDIKRRIAQAAAANVDEGETVMIESGSCCTLLAEELANAKKDITIITNSVFIANYIRHASRTRIILLGGYYQPESQVLVGPMTRKCTEIFFSEKFFIGTDGYLPDFGFTGKDHLRSQTIVDMAENAHKVIVLTDADKFSRQGVLGVMPFNKVNSVFTDERIPADIEKHLLENNISIHKVPEQIANSK